MICSAALSEFVRRLVDVDLKVAGFGHERYVLEDGVVVALHSVQAHRDAGCQNLDRRAQLVGSDDPHRDLCERRIDGLHEGADLGRAVIVGGANKIRAEKHNYEDPALFEAAKHARLEFVLCALVGACSELRLN